MFRKNKDHEQEQLFSPVKELPSSLKRKLEDHWSSYFYVHVFTQIDEEKFSRLYHVVIQQGYGTMLCLVTE
jgi:hypothetical protein